MVSGLNPYLVLVLSTTAPISICLSVFCLKLECTGIFIKYLNSSGSPANLQKIVKIHRNCPNSENRDPVRSKIFKIHIRRFGKNLRPSKMKMATNCDNIVFRVFFNHITIIRGVGVIPLFCIGTFYNCTHIDILPEILEYSNR